MPHTALPQRLLAAVVLALSPSLAPADVTVRFVPPDQAAVSLADLSFDAVRDVLETAKSGGELTVGLPFDGLAAFPEVSGNGWEVTISPETRSFVVSGAAEVRGIRGALFFAGTFPANGAGHYSFGVRPDRMRFGQWFPALRRTPLNQLGFDAAGLVVSDAPHTLPALAGIQAVLGAEHGALGVAGGLELFATVPSESFPGAGRALEMIGIEKSTLRLAGRIGVDPHLLFGGGDAQELDVELYAELETNSTQGLQAQLPPWVHVQGLKPSLLVRFEEPEVLVGLAFDARVDVGSEARDFRLSATYQVSATDESLTLRGETLGAWEHPFGIEWLSLESASLEGSVDASGAQASLHSTLAIGEKVATLDIAAFEDGPLTLEAGLDSLSIGDLTTFLAERTGSSFLEEIDIGDAVELTDMRLAIEHEERTTLDVSATFSLMDASADLLLSVTGGGHEDTEALFVVRRRESRLSDLLPALAGNPADIEIPESVWTLTPPAANAGTREIAASDLSSAARDFFSGVYGTEDFTLELEPGISFGAAIPMDALPSQLLEVLKIQAGSTLVLEGALAMSLDFESGRPSGTVESLDLRAELPATDNASAWLPAGLPEWMKPAGTSQRTLTLRFQAPSELAFMMSNDIEADIGGDVRHFRIDTQIAADQDAGSASWTGSMIGEWEAPFGVEALTLRDVSISAQVAAETGDGDASGAVVLEGGFAVGSKSGTMRLEIGAQKGDGFSGGFTGTLDSFSLQDVTQLGAFPDMPSEGLTRLNELLGALPALEQPTLSFELGAESSLAFTATTNLKGIETSLLVFVHDGKKGPAAILGVRPQNFSLGKLFPKLAENEVIAPFANLTLDNFGFLLAKGDQTLVAEELSPHVRAFFAGMTGDDSFDLKLSEGLTLAASIPTDILPADGPIGESLGIAGAGLGIATDRLDLRGTIGTSLSDLSLAAALPPLSPPNAPQWFQSGQLAVVLTGAPSLALEGTITVRVEKDGDVDVLDLIVKAAVDRQGFEPAVKLSGALQAEGSWDSPFGIEWLEIRRLSADISVSASASIALGAGGDVTIGEKDIDVYGWVKVNASGVPLGIVLDGKSEEGFALLDLAKFQEKIRLATGAGGPELIPLQNLPDIALRDLEFKIATCDVPDEDVTAGFTIRGDLYVPMEPGGEGSKLLSAYCDVGKEGIAVEGSLAASYPLGPLTWEDSMVDVKATLLEQHVILRGRVDLLGSYSEVDLELTRTGLSFATSRRVAGLWNSDLTVSSEFDLSNPTFHVHGVVENEFADQIEGTAIGHFTDFGKVAGNVAAAALNALQNAEAAKESIRQALGLPSATDVMLAVAKALADNAEASRIYWKGQTDAAYQAWANTPYWNKIARAARWATYAVLKMDYDENPINRVKTAQFFKNQYLQVKSGVDAFLAAQAYNQQVQAALASLLSKINNYPGKTIVFEKVTFDAGLEGLKDGLAVDLTLDLRFLGEPRTVEVPWTFGKPAENAQRIPHIVQQLVGPDAFALVFP